MSAVNWEDKYYSAAADLSNLLSQADIVHRSGRAFTNWIGDGSVLWEKPAFGKAFKAEVLKATSAAEAYYRTNYPNASDVDLEGLPRMVALTVATEAWIVAHPDRFPGVDTKG